MKNDKKTCSRIIPWILLVLVCVPILIGIKYSVPRADDFSFTNSLLAYKEDGAGDFKAAWEVGKTTYMTWQGAYFSNVTNALFSPFYRGGIKGYHAELGILTVFFVFSIAYTAWKGIKKFTNDFDLRSVAYVTILIFACATMRPELPEIFYWNCGALAYLLPLSMGVIACAYVAFDKSRKGAMGWIYVAFFSVISFLSVGATLIISAAVSGFMVLSVALQLINNKKFDKSMIVAAAAIVGSFVNAVAPGNFARQSVKEGNITVFDAIWYAFDYLIDAYYELIRNGSIIIITIVFLIVLWKKLDVDRFQFKYPVLVTIWLFVVSFLGIFPVVYGYKSKSTADRTDFVEDFIILFVLITVIIYWMGWIKKNKVRELPQSFGICAGTLLIAAVCIYCNSYTTDDLNYIRITRSYIDGGLKNYYESNMNVYYEIENADTQNVVLEIYQPENMDVYNDVYISDDPYHWINEAIATYYGKETLSVIYCDPDERE